MESGEWRARSEGRLVVIISRVEDGGSWRAQLQPQLTAAHTRLQQLRQLEHDTARGLGQLRAEH